MNRNLISVILILSLMGCAAAIEFDNGVEMRQGEAVAESLFEKGFGQPWIGGNPPSYGSSDFKSFGHHSRIWDGWYNPYTYHNYQWYNPCRYCYYYYPGSSLYPFYDQNTYTYHSGYWWS